VINVCRFRPDTSRTAEFLAVLWQGPVPDDLVLHRWLYVEGEPREMILVWEGDQPAREWVERCFGSFGQLTSEEVTNATGGLAACLDRDLEGFGRWLRGRGSAEDEIANQLDVRRRGMEAATFDQAVSAGREWAAGQSRP
jgi:hypothetical protein